MPLFFIRTTEKYEFSCTKLSHLQEIEIYLIFWIYQKILYPFSKKRGRVIISLSKSADVLMKK